MTGTMGKRDYGFAVRVPSESSNLLLNQRVLKLAPKPSVSGGFLLATLRSESFLQRLYSFPGGTKQANLSVKQIAELPVLIPPFSEQKKIAQILSTWDKAIATTEKLLANSQQQKKALMQQLLTGKKRLLDKNGVRFSGEWEWVPLRRIAQISGGKRLPKGESLQSTKTDHPYIRVTDMRMGKIAESNILYVPINVAPHIERYRVRKGDLYITVAGTLGLVGIVPPTLDGANLTENADRLSDIKCDRFYLLLSMMSPRFQQLIESATTQNAQPKLALTRLRDFSIPLPIREEQEAISKAIRIQVEDLEKISSDLDELRKEKKALMQQLLTGKRRVKTDEAAA